MEEISEDWRELEDEQSNQIKKIPSKIETYSGTDPVSNIIKSHIVQFDSPTNDVRREDVVSTSPTIDESGLRRGSRSWFLPQPRPPTYPVLSWKDRVKLACRLNVQEKYYVWFFFHDIAMGVLISRLSKIFLSPTFEVGP